MPVSVSSRYYKIPVYAAADAEQTRHPTVAIRPPTPPAQGATLYRHLVSGVESMEYLAWRYYGDSALWWRIAEANPLRFPLDLPAATPLDIPAATDIGNVVRDRRFG
jgi:nucleoid-associated protein YgaU